MLSSTVQGIRPHRATFAHTITPAEGHPVLSSTSHSTRPHQAAIARAITPHSPRPEATPC